jgi:predicted NAD/FAD-binding protein
MSVAVIGAGVAGIVASYLLQKKYNVTLFEKNEYVGGHTNTIVLDSGPDAGCPVDTGFIVCNDSTYPLFQKFLSQLEVTLRPTDMSFSFSCGRTGLTYASSGFNAWFSQRRNLVNPRFWRLLLEISRFNKRTMERLYDGSMRENTLGEYLNAEQFSSQLAEQYLMPMGAAIWSTPAGKMMEFPAESFARFFQNHGLLSLTDHPQWYFVENGSHSYVKAFLDSFQGTTLKNCSVSGVQRTESGVLVRREDGAVDRFDLVVIATHADEAYELLADPSEDERRLLFPWKYSENDTFLHTDTSFLPKHRRAWSCWNYVREATAESDVPVTVTYHMNRLQSLKTKNQYCVTLNPGKTISEEHVIREMHYHHPMYTFEALATQEQLPDLNGKNNTYFCGSYFGYGFHEDAVRSAVQVGSALGVTL